MYKAIVKTNNQVTNTSDVFMYPEQAQEWVLSQGFDIVPKKMKRSDALAQGIDVASLEPIIEDSLGYQIVYYMIPATQTYEIKDVTQEIQAENELLESKEAIILKNELQSEIRALNKRKLRSGQWDQAKFIAFVSSPLIKDIERALNQASFGTYASLVYQATEFYTPEEIQQIIGKVLQHVQKWQAKGVY